MRRRTFLLGLAAVPVSYVAACPPNSKSKKCPHVTPTPTPTPTPSPEDMPLLNYPHPPRPPAPYAIPGGATSVTTGAALQTALNGNTAIDIVCEDGTYDRSTYFDNSKGHRVYARNLHGAVFTAGFNLRGGNGAIFQGLKFNITDATKTHQSSVFHVWDAATPTTNISFLDLDMNGNAVLAYGLYPVTKDSLNNLIARRLVIRNFTDVGVRISNNAIGDVVTTAATLEDLDISGIKRATPTISDGTAEAGIWIGNKANVRRIKIRDCGWMGINTISSCDGSLIEHFDIDDIRYSGASNYPAGGIGIYLEHKTLNTTFRYGYIGKTAAKVIQGMTMEWNGADPNQTTPTGAAHDCIIEDSVIASRKIGVYLDPGQLRNTIRRVKFINQCYTCIGNNSENVTNTFTNNNYSEKDAGCVDTNTSHTSSGTCGTGETGYTS